MAGCAAAASTAHADEVHAAFFLPNRGQFPEGGIYAADLPRWRASFSVASAAFRAKRLVGDPGPFGVSAGRGGGTELVHLRLDLLGAEASSLVGEDQRKGRSDFFFHGDPKSFVRNLPHYYRLRYRNVWPGGDLVFRVWQRAAELQPIVQDRAAVSRMAYRWQGAPIAKAGGGIQLAASWGRVRHLAPRIAGGGSLSGAYRRDQNGVVLFA